MNIENMEEIEKEYFYIIEVPLIKKENFSDIKYHFEMDIEIPYHFRYGAANLKGSQL